MMGQILRHVNLRKPLLSLFAGLLSACTSASYLPNLLPSDRVFQKSVVGGAASFAGAELASPGFTLYADGTVLYFDHLEDGRRALVASKLTSSEFRKWYDRINRILAMPFDSLPTQPMLPVSIFWLRGRELRIPGLGFTAKGSAYDSLQAISLEIDQRRWPAAKPFLTSSVQLYVKAVGAGDGAAWPPWKIQEIALEKIFRKDISFYGPNSEDNSVMLTGPIAAQIQAVIGQPGVYKKFAYLGGVWAAGYRVILP